MGARYPLGEQAKRRPDGTEVREADRVVRPARRLWWVAATVLAAVAGCAADTGSQAERDLTADTAAEAMGAGTTTTHPAATTQTIAATATTVSTSTSTTTTSTTPTTTTTSPPEPTQLRLAFTGDTLPHSPLWRQAERNAAAAGNAGFDFRPMLAGLAPVVAEADLAVCHLETPIAPAGEPFSTSPIYGVPPEIADAIAHAGYDRCSTASNHTADRGAAGIDRTVAVLESRGIGQSGMARTPNEILPRVFDLSGVGVSHLSYTWSYNGLSLPGGEEWRSALIDPARIIADATEARQQGADLVVVSLHWGAEGVHAPTQFQLDVADEITASGLIDVVIGHHAHVLQPIAQVNGVWVLYGLGNILSNLPTSDRWPAASQDAAVVTIDMEIGQPDPTGARAVAIDRPTVRPTWVDREAGWIVRDVLAELARDDLGAGQRGRLEASLARTQRIVGDFIPAA